MRKFGIVGAAIAVAAGVLAALAVAAGSGGTTAYDSTGTITDSGPFSQGSLCPSGQSAKAVGVSTRGIPAQNDSIAITGLVRNGDNAANASVISFNPPALLAAIAYCSKGGPTVKARKATETIPDSSVADKPGVVSASCKGDEKLLSGGFRMPASNASLTLAGQYRSGKAWKTQVFNFSNPDQVTSVAYCAKGDQKLTTATSKVAVAPGQMKSAKAKCKSGSHVVFGGYKGSVTYSKAYVLLRTSKRIDRRTWKITASNQNSSNGGSLTAYAYCVEN